MPRSRTICRASSARTFYLTDAGPRITELDSVPGGIGLTAWLNQTYAALPQGAAPVIGGADGMMRGFAGMFNGASAVHIVISDEAQTYRPGNGLAGRPAWGKDSKCATADSPISSAGEGVYRFFELFDLPNVPSAPAILDMARREVKFN